MKVQSRVQNSMRNTAVGLSAQGVRLIALFITRTVFIKRLGAEYLGAHGLYSNILAILSLAELGLSAVFIYSLYKPLARNDHETIKNLMQYYKKIYRYIALVILSVGLILVPFLPLLTNSKIPMGELQHYYVLVLLNSVLSYLFIYKSVLINADQKLYLINVTGLVFFVLQNVLQIIVLIFLQSYTLYLIIQLSCTLLNNITIHGISNKRYPYLKEKITQKIDVGKELNMNDNVKSMFLFKLGSVMIDYTDNILISVMLGTVMVGYYANYVMLITVVNVLIGIISKALYASVGNLNASEDIEKSYGVFNGLMLFFHWIGSVCALCFLLVFNDFITIWIGEEFLLDSIAVYAIVLRFYITCISNQNWIYRESFGLFRPLRFVMLAAAGVNMVLSVILGKIFGLFGILLATSIGKLFTVFWYEPRVLYKQVFKKPVKEYWTRQMKHFVTTWVAVLIGVYVTAGLTISPGMILLKIFIALVIVSALFLFFNRKNPDITFFNRSNVV